jgi:hypothetical protein
MLSLKRSSLILAFVLVYLSLPIIGSYVFPHSEDQQQPPTVVAADYPGRSEYQASLNASPQRFEPDFSMIVLDGRAYMRTDRDEVGVMGYCSVRCGVMLKQNGKYYISLPVGYVHTSNVVPDPTSWTPVTQLTYWNPATHRVETQTSESDSVAVKLPEILSAFRSAKNLKAGDTAYTNAQFIRELQDGSIYMIDGSLAYEPIGHDYGYVINTAITRRADGELEAKLPTHTRPLPTEDMLEGVPAVRVTVVP